MKKLVVWCVILMVLTYGAFKGIAWYQVNRLILEVKRTFEQHMALSHGWISTSIWGGAVIHDLQVTPFQLRYPLEVKEVEISLDSPFDFIDIFSLIDADPAMDPPGAMEIRWQNMSLPLSENWMNYIDFENIDRDLFGLACGPIESIGVTELEQMGYGNIPLNQKLAYRYDDSTQRMTVSFESELEGLGVYSGEVELGLSHSLQWPFASSSGSVRLHKIYLAYDDRSFIKRATLLCGKAAGFTKAEFIVASTQKTQRKLERLGISLSDEFLRGYGTFLQGDGIIEFQAEPMTGIALNRLASFSEAELNQALNYSIKVNRINLPNAVFALNSQKLTDYLYPPPVVEEPKPEPKVATPTARFQPVAVAYAEQFLDQRVRIIQSSGKVTEGVLQAAAGSYLDIGVKVGSGTVKFHVNIREVEDFLVFSERNLLRLRGAPVEEVQSGQAATGKNFGDLPVVRLPAETGAVSVTAPSDVLSADESATGPGPGSPAAGSPAPGRPAPGSPAANTIIRETVIYVDESGREITEPFDESKYEIIDVEPATPITQPTINDLPVENSESQQTP